MSGIKNLNTLLHSMKPKHIKGSFVFCVVSNDLLLKLKPVMFFNEEEGITVIIEQKVADKHDLKYEAVWAMITLTVHSDLNAVGFLATITKKLAENDISVNAVSAYYHDHLFVPMEMKDEALKILLTLSKD